MQKLQFISVITQFICTKVGCHSKIKVVPNTAGEAVQMWLSHIQTWRRLCWLHNFSYSRSLNFMSVLWWGPVLSAHGGIQIRSDGQRASVSFLGRLYDGIGIFTKWISQGYAVNPEVWRHMGRPLPSKQWACGLRWWPGDLEGKHIYRVAGG